MKEVNPPSVRPSAFARLLLTGLEVAAAHSRRRKRDQKPDEMGLNLKRVLLERIVADDPDPDAFGDWLLDEVLTGAASGPRRAVAADVLAEYHLAMADPSFARWLGEQTVRPAGERRRG